MAPRKKRPKLKYHLSNDEDDRKPAAVETDDEDGRKQIEVKTEDENGDEDFDPFKNCKKYRKNEYLPT